MIFPNIIQRFFQWQQKKLLKIIKSIFQETFFLDYPQIRVDDNKNTHSLPLHQEIFGQMSSKILTLWMPLTNVSKKMAPLALVKKVINLDH